MNDQSGCSGEQTWTPRIKECNRASDILLNVIIIIIPDIIITVIQKKGITLDITSFYAKV